MTVGTKICSALHAKDALTSVMGLDLPLPSATITNSLIIGTVCSDHMKELTYFSFADYLKSCRISSSLTRETTTIKQQQYASSTNPSQSPRSTSLMIPLVVLGFTAVGVAVIIISVVVCKKKWRKPRSESDTSKGSLLHKLPNMNGGMVYSVRTQNTDTHFYTLKSLEKKRLPFSLCAMACAISSLKSTNIDKRLTSSQHLVIATTSFDNLKILPRKRKQYDNIVSR